MENQQQEASNSNGAMVAQPRTGQVMRRDFSGDSLTQTNAITEAMVAAKRADVEARWIMAMRSPRNLDQARQDILAECRRPGFAEVAIYARPVGRKFNEETGQWEEAFVEGLSIRFAEVAVRCMRNISAETETVYDAETERRVRVSVCDLETNVLWRRDITISKTVERKKLKKNQRPLGERENSYGERVYIVRATDDEVNVKEAAEVSKASRTGILRVVPGHLQDEAMKLCKQIAADRDAKDPSAARNRMFDAFANVGVKPTDIEQWLGHSTDQISPTELEQLRKLFAAIADGEVTWADAMVDAEARRSSKPTETKPVEAKPTTTQQTAAAPAPTPAPAPPPPPAEKKTGGKGAAAMKDKLKSQEKKDEAKADDPEAEPGWMGGDKAEEKPVYLCPKCNKVPCEPPGICEACANE